MREERKRYNKLWREKEKSKHDAREERTKK